MKHPRQPACSRIAATVAALDGGMNVGTDASLVGDGQLSECRNLQWIDGALRTRRGFVTDADSGTCIATDRAQYFVDRDGYTVVLSIGHTEFAGYIEVATFDPYGHVGTVTLYRDGTAGLHAFVAPAGGSVADAYTCIVYCSDGEIYGLHPAYDRCDSLRDQSYLPRYLINGTPCDTRVGGESGVRAEAPNCLNDRVNCEFTADGRGIYFPLPDIARLPITVTVEGVTYTAGGAAIGKRRACVDTDAMCVWMEQDGVPYAVPMSTPNNVVVTITHNADIGKPMCYGGGMWYGAGSVNHQSGERLYVYGDEGFVRWSAPQDPLYFPASGYVVVGAPFEAVTALAKQSDALIVFKRREIFTIRSRTDDAVTADEIQSGAAVDVTAAADISVIPLHSEIGCDLPDTVALCGNRLMWACADGSVYRLDTVNRLQQQCIHTVDTAVRRLLREEIPDHASAVVVDEKYRLLWGARLFTATDETTPRWWMSTVDVNVRARQVCRVEGGLRLAGEYRVGTSPFLFWFREEGERDSILSHSGEGFHDARFTVTARPIMAQMCTKQFLFGETDTYKQITRVFAEADADGAVQATYVTERGEQIDLPCMARDGVRLTPGGLRCRRFALRLSGNRLTVGAITIHLVSGLR